MEPNLFLLILLLLSHLSSSFISSSMSPLCNEHDQITLLQLKHSFSLDQPNCVNSNPSLLSWVHHNETNITAGCCSWEGVTCEISSGRVIGLDLSYGCLHGPLNSTNPIFQMTSLRKLNLAGNEFAQSQIPSDFGKFSILNSLNLSQASFSGSIPLEILALSSLTSLDLSGNPSLHLPRHGLASIAHNMKHLTELSLSQINMYSFVPATFVNLTSLRMLQLQDCNLQDHFPIEIFLLPRLESVNLMNNLDLYGRLPEFPMRSSLRSLELSSTNFHGELPRSIGNLISLQRLDIGECNFSGSIPYTIGNLVNITRLRLSHNQFSGPIPSSLENLTSLTYMNLAFNPFSPSRFSWIGKLTRLSVLSLAITNLYGSIPSSISKLAQIEVLDLGYNNLSGQIPSSLENLTSLTFMSLAYNPFSPSRFSWIGKLTRLSELYLTSTNLYGSIPSSLSKLAQIEELYLGSNYLSGQIPSSIGNLLQLGRLVLGDNNLEGQIPSSIFSLKNLESLLLSLNKLSGTMDISMFHDQKNINLLDLSSNQLSVVSNKFMNFSLPNLELLDLTSCNMREFPLFLKNQDMLKYLSLENNSISGEIPAWFLNVSTKTMSFLDLSHNFLTRFEKPVDILPWSIVQIFDVGFNNIHGSLPLPPPSISIYILSNNSLGGELSPTICQANTFSVLDLSYNELGGAIPKCLGKLGSSLQILNLRGNKFKGKIPQIQTHNCSIRWINLSQNNLKGKLPRTLANCKDLERLDVGNNHITDTFPSWLGTLPKLQVLILKMNNFHGPMESPSSMADFPELRIVDLSNNALTGALPSEYFPLWKAMFVKQEKRLTYLLVNLNCSWNIGSGVWTTYYYSMSTEIMNKGMDREYDKLSTMMVYISLSGNKFVGEIPESIGDLVGLVGLDLSSNNLTGSIPTALGELKELESLDLSLNMLYGEIPQQLSQLTFLAYLNVSDNNLSGRIPDGGQLRTFGNSSFDGNPGLWGLPLSNRRGDANEPTAAAHEERDHGSSDHTKLVLSFEGFATGLAIGLGIGYIITTRNHQLFVKTCLRLRYRK